MEDCKMKGIKVFVFSVLATGLLLSTANAQMMGQGKGMKCDKMGMMERGGGPGMMSSGMMGGMGMHGKVGERDMMHGDFMKKGLHFYFTNRDALGLTDDQLDKLHKIKTDFKKSYIMDEAKLKVAKLELEELLDADNANMKSIEKKVKEIAGLKESLLLAKVKTRTEAKKLLTEEQRKKAKELRPMKKGPRRMEMMGGMGSGSEEMSMEGMELDKTATAPQGEGHEEHH